MSEHLFPYIFAAAIMVAVLLLSYLVRNSSKRDVMDHKSRSLSKPVSSPVSVSTRNIVSVGGYYDRTDADLAFEERVRDQCNFVIKKTFYAKLAGVTFPNVDGTKRLPVVRICRVGEVLLLTPDDSIVGHPGAVAIHRSTGGQLGYLDARLAGEVRRDGLTKWVCVFRRNLYKPETKILAGAVLYMARLRENEAA